ncbi:hypothetical protein HaLaN_25007 [Haematococcus lacustris]|uniref:Uncharacterized protein n=1 Tax=Haematococcus lacustris TaxID=44745 RepID=A0A699ZXP2_HAELA|nr:hypothetical protein HaLaN_25007 [Haematococcus lacustris]
MRGCVCVVPARLGSCQEGPELLSGTAWSPAAAWRPHLLLAITPAALPGTCSPRGPVTTGGHRASRRHPASSTAVPRLLVPGPAGAGSFTVASTQDRDVASDAGSEQGGSCQDSQRSAGEAHSSTTQQPGQEQGGEDEAFRKRA